MKPGLTIKIGAKPKADEYEDAGGGDNMSEEAGKMAAKELIDAVKSGDEAAVWSAFKALRDC